MIGLTHDQRRERRRQMAEEYAAGASREQIAAKYNCTSATVSLAVKEFKAKKPGKRKIVYDAVEKVLNEIVAGAGIDDAMIKHNCFTEQVIRRMARQRGISIPRRPTPANYIPPHAKVSRYDWDRIDFSKQDTVLAVELGISRERVRQIRRLSGAPNADFHHCHPGTIGYDFRKWAEMHKDQLAGMTTREITDAYGGPIENGVARSVLRRMNIPIQKYVPLLDRLDRHSLGKIIVEQQFRDDMTSCWVIPPEYNVPDNNGYPCVSGTFVHHRVWEIYNGPRPKGKKINHRCLNNKCINPAHLYAGEPEDTGNDRIRYGRATGRLLDPFIAAEIRREYAAGGLTIADLAKKHGVNQVSIWKIIKGRAYRA